MKYFFDTEFIEDGSTIDLLSLGIVAQDGREFYQCNQDAKLNRADEWVIWNVFPHLGVKHSDRWYWSAPKIDVDNRSNHTSIVIPHHEIRERVKTFISGDDKPEFWAYYADYDWVAFCQLFGRMIDLPKGWPMYCRDVKQLCASLGDPKLPEQSSTEHHALNDAKWTRDAYLFLHTLEPVQECVWTWSKTYFNVGCGRSWHYPANEIKYCPFCGKAIREVRE